MRSPTQVVPPNMLPGSKDPDINSVQAVALKTLMANYEGIAAGGCALLWVRKRCTKGGTVQLRRYLPSAPPIMANYGGIAAGGEWGSRAVYYCVLIKD